MSPRLSIIVPALNESAGIGATLRALQPYRRRGVEVVLVDGGSDDGTIEIARPLVDRLVESPRGRAAQMNAGAASAQAAVLLFLHADTLLPEGADAAVVEGLAQSGRSWGRFDVRIAGRPWLLGWVARLMNLRSRLSGVATGDQAIFIRREAFTALGGFPDQALMEDIEFSLRARRQSRPLCLRGPVVTSGRRWETRGVVRTIVLMWRLRWLYARGADPRRLAELYR